MGCHPDADDSPKALATAVHQLRQAPDYLDALSLPLPMHLASLAQQYILPTVTASETDSEEEQEGPITGVARPSPHHDSSEDLATRLVIIIDSAEMEADAEEDPEHALDPGLAQPPRRGRGRIHRRARASDPLPHLTPPSAHRY